MLDLITPTILTFNEEANLDRTLTALNWAGDVIVIDSFSSDKTLEICAQYSNVRVIQNPFSSNSEQNNFALSQVTKTPWVLSMDADYIVTPELKKELSTLKPKNGINGYQINFKYVVRGKVLKGSLYPPRACLYLKEKAHYIQDGHTQRVQIQGTVSKLNSFLLHDDRKPYSRWLTSQRKYANEEALKMSITSWQDMSLPDRVRYFGLGPFVVIPYTLFAKGLIFNGAAGLEYTYQRFIAELYLLRARINKK